MRLRLDDRTVDLEHRRVHHDDGSDAHLTTREAQVLELLLAEAGHTVATEDLIAAVWGHASEAAVHQTIKRLRTKLERNPREPTWLLSVHGAGYRLARSEARQTVVAGPNLGSAPDDFVVLHHLEAEGPFQTWLAREATLDRHVVLRVHANSSPDTAAAFRRDMRRLAQVRCPHLEAVLRIGTSDGTPYVALEHVEGASLSESTSTAPVTLRDAVAVGRDVAVALAHAHAADLVHGRISAEHVILGRDRVVLVGFGDAPPDASAKGDIVALGALLSSLVPSRPDLDALIAAAVEGRASAVDLARGLGEVAESLDQRQLVPVPGDSFIGRATDLAALGTAFGTARLVTLVGSGGAGKTRLSLRYAAQSAVQWPGGVVFCDLSEARSKDTITAVLAQALQLGRIVTDPVARIGAALAGRGQVLVVLDNFEQIVAEAAATLGVWLQTAPQARFLVTSRVVLGLPGEHVHVVDALVLSDALDLLQDRIAAAAGSRPPRDATLEALAELLDRMPLAIELAAARARVLAPDALVARLSARFRLLQAAPGTRPDRHATLWGTLQWSWDLLGSAERQGLATLSVFEGGFDLEAAEVVLAAGVAGVEILQALVDHSLVRRAEGRFHLLVSVREFAAEHLSALGDEEAARRRHAARYAAVARAALDADVLLQGSHAEQQALLRDRDNFAAAARWSLQAHEVETAAWCAWAYGEIMVSQDLPSAEALALLHDAAARDGVPRALEARMVRLIGESTLHMGDRPRAIATLTRAVSLARDAQDPIGTASALRHLATAIRNTDWTSAEACIEDSLAVCRAHGLRYHEAIAVGLLALFREEQTRFDEAEALYLRSLALHATSRNRRAEALIRLSYAIVLMYTGRLSQALSMYDEAEQILAREGWRRSIGFVLLNRGIAEQMLGHLDKAQRSFHGALAEWRVQGRMELQGKALASAAVNALLRGHPTDAATRFDEALALFRAQGDRRDEALTYTYQARLAHAQGDRARAKQLLDEAVRLLDAVNAEAAAHLARAQRAALLAETGVSEDLDATLHEAVEVATRHGDPTTLAKILCHRAPVYRIRGDDASFEADRQRAAALADGLGVGPTSELGQMIAKLRGP